MQYFAYPELQEFAKQLQDAGATIIVRERRDGLLPTWFHFAFGNSIGYCQFNNVGGFSFSSVHKPSKNNGTGFRLDETEPTVETARKAAFLVFPNWAQNKNVAKYADIEEFISKERILTYEVLPTIQ